MKKGCWADEEVKDLFWQVEDVKKRNRPLKDAFIVHAQKYRRKPNSVRNYYYYQLLELEKDAIKTKRLGINLDLHKKAEIEYFSSADEDKLIKDIDNLVKSGMSTRRACQQLSGGDLNLMMRYQNKYRNYLAKQRGVKDNIIAFKKKKSTLTESDINSLFLGLVRLVKRNAIEEYEGSAKAEREGANAMLRKALVQLTQKEREIERLKESFAKLQLENSKLVQNMMKMKIQKAQDISQNNAKI